MDGGSARKGDFGRLVAIPAQGRPAVTYAGFRAWFAKAAAAGEVSVGAGPIAD